VKTYGLTGGIATGKTSVEGILQSLGIPAFDADAYARRVVEPGQPAYAEIVEAFGRGVLQRDGAIDRQALGRVVYADAAKRALLERITHPRIMGTIFDEVALLRRAGEPITVISAALLFEAGYHTRLDGVLVVTCSAAEQLMRIMERDGFTESQARQRIEAQMPLGDKAALADWLIDTSGPREETARLVEALVQRWRSGDGYSS